MLCLDPHTFSCDRRRSPRGPLYMMVEPLGHRAPLWARDISMGGLRCESSRPLWPGTYLDLGFSLPDTRERIEVGGQVMSLDGSGAEALLGLRFCLLADSARLAIYRFLDRRRRLWRPEGWLNPLAVHHPRLAHIFEQPDPFAALLAAADEALAS
jgi:hypothetical protein